MKRSSMVMLGGGIILFLMIFLFFVISRFQFNKIGVNDNKESDYLVSSGVTENKEYNFTNFEELEFLQSWNVNIIYGDQYKIVVTASESIINKLHIKQAGNRVHFSMDSHIDTSVSNYSIFAEITMPDIRKIQVKGAADISLDGFNLESLELINSGAGQIDAQNMEIENLILDADGATYMDFSSIDIKNCRMEIDGVGNISLNMNGGELSGYIRGAANVMYKGSVSKEDVKVSGVSVFGKM